MLIKHVLTCAFSLVSIHVTLGQTVTTIHEIQMVDTGGGTDASTFVGQEVQVTGVVTASAESNNLGSVYIQEEELVSWAGIQLKSGSGLGGVEVGDLVQVTGTVFENSGMTIIDFISEVEILGTGDITPLQLTPETFTAYDLAANEQYEGMLIELQNGDDPIKVVNTNADGPGNNFGEWRVGSDLPSADDGCRVLTGRQTSTIGSSLNVSWVNDDVWATNSGTMLVDPIVVQQGDGFEFIRGVMHFSQSNFKILPRNNDDILPELSSIRNVKQAVSDARVFPNPGAGEWALTFTLDRKAALSIHICDEMGRVLHTITQNESFTNGSHRVEDSTSLPPGVYYIMITGEGGRSVETLIRTE